MRRKSKNGTRGSSGTGADNGAASHGFTGKWKHTIGSTVKAMTPKEVQNAARFAKYMPLVAAIIAPLSTLLDIAGLTQPWYSYYGRHRKDSPGCIALSSVGLFLNVMANLLLLMRFSSGTSKWWRRGASLSLIFWIAKTIIALVNVFYYGLAVNPKPGYSFTEGFWCAVVSLIMAGVISICLGFNFCLAIGKIENKEGEDLRSTGRKFLFSVTLFMFLIGMQALAYCRLEHWSYLDAIYFSIQCALTVGYGDLVPTTAVAKVLLFPFAVLTISQLANEVSIIIDFVKNRSEDRREKWRKRYSVAMHKAAIERRPYATLIDEMSLIHQINLHQETMVQLFDLFWSGMALATFWLIGALIFHFVEGWGYGNAVYAVMVLSLTIGFGDFTPKTPAGRTIWVVYALMAVPVVTNFAVQTVTGIMYTWSEHRFARSRFELERERDPEIFAPHSHFILRYHEQWDNLRDTYLDTRGKAVVELKGLQQIRTAPNPHRTPPSSPVEATPKRSATMPPMSSMSTTTTTPNLPLAPSRFRFPQSPGSAPLTSPSSGGSHGSAKPPPVSPTQRTIASSKDAHRRPSVAEERVIGEMLKDPDAHDDVVQSLGRPSIDDASAEEQDNQADGPQEDKGEVPRLDTMQEAVDEISQEDGEDATSNPSTQATRVGEQESKYSELDAHVSIDKKADKKVRDREMKKAATKLDDSSLSPTTTTTTGPTTTTTKSEDSHYFRAPVRPSLDECSPSMGPRLMETDSTGKHSKIELTGDPVLDSNRMELYIIKELVDRVTRLEAQSRQMLIDTMDQDIARTLLLADRNLQIRDAFQLYGNEIDLGKTYEDEAEKTRVAREERQKKNEELHRQAAVMDDTAGSDDDMLSRVRRYRNTFAEVLVISSMLLKLEGDDLKRFERWHVGDLHHPKPGRRDNAIHENPQRGHHRHPSNVVRRHARRLSHFVSGELPSSTSADTSSRHKSFFKFGSKDGPPIIPAFGSLKRDPNDSGEYNHGIHPGMSTTIQTSRVSMSASRHSEDDAGRAEEGGGPGPGPGHAHGQGHGRQYPDSGYHVPESSPSSIRHSASSASLASTVSSTSSASATSSHKPTLRERHEKRRADRHQKAADRHRQRHDNAAERHEHHKENAAEHMTSRLLDQAAHDARVFKSILHRKEGKDEAAYFDGGPRMHRHHGELGVENPKSASKRLAELESLSLHQHLEAERRKQREKELRELAEQTKGRVEHVKAKMDGGKHSAATTQATDNKSQTTQIAQSDQTAQDVQSAQRMTTTQSPHTSPASKAPHRGA